MTPPPLATSEDPECGNRMTFWDFGKCPETNIYRLQVRLRLEAYDVEAAVDPAKVGAYDRTTPEYLLYTRSERTIALGRKVHELAIEAVGSQTNPYLQARRMAKCH